LDALEQHRIATRDRRGQKIGMIGLRLPDRCRKAGFISDRSSGNSGGQERRRSAS